MYNPYKWVRDDLSYNFETDNGVPYKAYFENISLFFGDHALGYTILTFSIEVVGSIDITKIPIDPRIPDTVQDILSGFFEHDESALVVVYDSLDKRTYARKRKFNSWFQSYNLTHVAKRDYLVIEEGVEIPSTLFVHCDHPHKDLLFDVYQRLVDNGGYLE